MSNHHALNADSLTASFGDFPSHDPTTQKSRSWGGSGYDVPNLWFDFNDVQTAFFLNSN